MKQTYSETQPITTASKQMVWYVCYGSNVSQERFDYYIRGGIMPANNKTYLGCRDKTPPRLLKKMTLHHELYFAQNSSVWGGGVAFIDEHESPDAQTYGYAYLITLEQFSDVVRQENDLKQAIQLSLQDIVSDGKAVFRQLGLYGEILYLGDIDGIPSLTFTAEYRNEAAKPSGSYLRQIASGLRQDYDMTRQEVAYYLASKPGVSGSYSTAELVQLQIS